MAGETSSSSKEEIVTQLLSEGDVMLCLDARQENVQVEPAPLVLATRQLPRLN